ncbi:choice-of-anchor D domain-containing protein [Sphaerotilus uruguayifluvii]|uniref:Cytochrome c553 n=1 Tax=Sphaerotilus uruguayifluvii TaxID=2735897 RepID=A0ABX2G3S3_9BURK|nr:choice-of-anchor D domain-containing protein [Leptothrix sp. C29]NRT56650.1 cytochrome c553 [Leptothrix sp. C29]
MSTFVPRAAGLALLLAATGASQAQNFGLAAPKCAGCHTNPPTVQATTPNDCSGYAVGLSEDFVGNASNLQTRLNASCSMMKSVADTLTAQDRDAVAAYLLNLRDALAVPAAATLTFPGTTATGATRTASTSFTLSNYRGAELTLALSSSNPRFSVTRKSSSTCTALTVPAASSSLTPGTCRLDLDVVFQPQPADVVAPQTSATLTSTLTVTPTYAGSDVQPSASAGGRTITVDATAYRPTVTLSPQALAFGEAVIGGASVVRTVQISSTYPDARTYALTLPAGVTEDSPGCAGRVIAADSGVCTVSLRWQPTAAAISTPLPASIPVTITGTGGTVSTSLGLSGTAAWPLTASPTRLTPSAAGPVSTALSNRGSTAIVLGAPTFTGTAKDDYRIAAGAGCTPGSRVDPGLSCTLTLDYTPTASGNRQATLAIAHDSAVGGSPLSITLDGTADIGQLSLDAAQPSFPDTVLGATPSGTVTVTAHNTGSKPLTLNALSLGGPHPGDFLRAGTCAAGNTLAVGATCTVTLQFSPGATGIRSATLSIAHDGAAPNPSVLTLTGLGLPQPVGVLTIDAANPLDVGSQTVNGLYGTRTVRLRNSGTASLQLTGVTLSGSGFSLDSTPSCAAGTTLAIGQTCDLALRFTPLAADTDYRATLSIAHSAAGSPSRLSVTGHGSAAVVPVVTWVGGTEVHDFGTQAIGAAGTTRHTVSLRNLGPGAIRLTLINTIGLEAAMFPVQGGAADACVAGALLEPDRTCSITLAFSPGSPGTHGARLQVVSSGTALAPLALTGTGLGPVGGSTLAVTPERLDLGTARVGAASPPGEIVLRADAQSAVQVIGWAVDGAFVVEGRTCPAPPFTLAAGTDCRIAVRFVPTAAGNTGGTLQVTSSPGPDLAVSVRSVPLAGRGESAPDVVGGGGGGCSIARVSGDETLDPTLLVLAALAALILGRRGRRRRPPTQRAS